MMLIINDKPAVEVNSRTEWRRWLNKNHQTCREIWLVYYKKHTGRSNLTKVEANKEALCFGWIDSLIQTIDDERYMQKFTPRHPESKWSELNKRRVTKLFDDGLMTSAGERLVIMAKASGEWDKCRDDPAQIETPKRLTDALSSNDEAMNCWSNLRHSQRRQYCLWIHDAKREATKQRRTQKTINMLTSGQSLNTL